MSRCIHVYPFVARNHGGIPFSGVCPLFYSLSSQLEVDRFENGGPFWAKKGYEEL